MTKLVCFASAIYLSIFGTDLINNNMGTELPIVSSSSSTLNEHLGYLQSKSLLCLTVRKLEEPKGTIAWVTTITNCNSMIMEHPF